VYISAEWFRHIQCMLVGNTNNGPSRTFSIALLSFELSRQYSVYFLPNGLGTYSVCWSAILTMARLGHRSPGSLDVHSYCVGFVFYNEHFQ
jgi:hypothetical protein